MKSLKYLGISLSFILIFLLVVAPVSAIASETADPSGEETKSAGFAIGYEVAFPLCYGLTLSHDFNPSFAIQGLVTMSPQPIMLSTVKILYKMKPKSSYPNSKITYAYALIGQFEDDPAGNFEKRVKGYSLGLGAEFTPKGYPHNYKNYFEFGYIHFDSSKYNPSLTVSAGIKVYY